MSAQQIFNTATAAYSEGRFDEAARGFAQIETKVKSPRVLAVVRLRKGRSLLNLGRAEEGEANIRTALAVLPADDPDMRDEIFDTRLEIGAEALGRLDYATASQDGNIALRLATSNMDRMRTSLLLAKAAMFEPDDASVRYADAALSIATKMPKVDKKLLAAIHTVHARALLNHGQKAAAYTELRQALGQQGGLDLKVEAAEVVTRSDLALAALLNDDRDSARKYLAYTGAGRTGGTPFGTAFDMQAPVCGGEDGLKPDDLAIVEFAILDDGQVAGASPVYSSRLGNSAVTFARAVSQWSWSPESAKKIPGLFRLLTRVELHCTTAEARPALLEPFWDRMAGWLAGRGVTPYRLPEAVGPALTAGKAELDRRRARGGGLDLVPVLLGLGANEIATSEERRAWLAEAGKLLSDDGAPIELVTMPRIAVIGEGKRGRWGNDERTVLRAILAEPAIGQQAELADTIRLMIAEPRFYSRSPADAEALVKAVADDKRLRPSHPLRVGAFARLASLQAAAGRLEDARASYVASGLSTQQCALADARPALRTSGADSSDFPREAMEWGFAGWVRTEFDIGADGHTINQRAIIAYPPFVFQDSAVKMTRAFRYTTSYRPGGTAGCSGEQQTIRFGG